MLLGGDDGDDTEATVTLGGIEEGPDVVELSIVPTRAIGLLELKDGNVLVGGERLHLPPEAVADLLEQRRRRDREAKVLGQKRHHLPADLQIGHVRVQVEPVHAGEVERNMALEHVIDVHHAGHRTSLVAGGPALPARQPHRARGNVGRRPGGGACPPPASIPDRDGGG